MFLYWYDYSALLSVLIWGLKFLYWYHYSAILSFLIWGLKVALRGVLVLVFDVRNWASDGYPCWCVAKVDSLSLRRCCFQLLMPRQSLVTRDQQTLNPKPCKVLAGSSLQFRARPSRIAILEQIQRQLLEWRDVSRSEVHLVA